MTKGQISRTSSSASPALSSLLLPLPLPLPLPALASPFDRFTVQLPPRRPRGRACPASPLRSQTCQLATAATASPHRMGVVREILEVTHMTNNQIIV